MHAREQGQKLIRDFEADEGTIEMNAYSEILYSSLDLAFFIVRICVIVADVIRLICRYHNFLLSLSG